MTDRIEVDGVPTLVAPTSGPMRAGLVFRVGRADETLARGGITHLVEHLAMYRHGLTDYHYNGITGTVVTHFYTQGNEDDVVSFLTGVCDGLTNLPFERLDTEKQILRTEENSRSGGVNDRLPLWRYGARDYGLVSYPEWGLSEITADDVRRWVDTWFTRQNAVLWIAGDGVPAGLRLPLPDGVRRPVPAPSSALPVTPAYFQGTRTTVVLDSLVRRRSAAPAFTGVLERELFRALRQEGGFSYTIGTSYDPRGDDFATITTVADALPEKRDAALGAFVDVLAKLKVGRIDQSDLDAYRTKAEEAMCNPDVAAARLPGRAVDLVTGQPDHSLDELREQLHAVTVEDVHEVAVEAMGAALLMVPEGHRADWAGFTAAPTASERAVSGAGYRSREDIAQKLIVGPEGVSIVAPDAVATVRYDQCAAKLAWPDGARQLIGYDGMSLRIEPTLYAVTPAALAPIDAAVPASVTVPMPARRPDAIPQPDTRQAGRTARKGGVIEKTVMIVLFVVAGLVACVTGLATFGGATDPESRSDSDLWLGVGLFWFVAVMLALPAVLIARQRRKAGRR
ncbi:M16 family metallopeptidase [Planosporangium sp. 12N6]|uniref:M16 family metallopeptidase n=1 Tax=Planosporangium spinosum TaxID=3402278 RepID=UPI003CF66235